MSSKARRVGTGLVAVMACGIAWVGWDGGRTAHAAPTCTYEPRTSSSMGLPEALVGPTVSLAHCTEGGVTTDSLHAALRLGPLEPIPVSGPYLGAGACLTARTRAEIWPGFAPDLEASVCRGADGAWTPRVSGRLPIAGTALPLVDAVVEQLAGASGPVRLRLPRLALGPFTLDQAVVTTALDRGRLVPRRIEGTLRWNDVAGGTALAVAGDLAPDRLELGVSFAGLPPDVPFPGVTLPPFGARLALVDDEWRFFLRAEGPAALGPLGSVSLAGSELEVRFRDGQWALAGCLESQPRPVDLGLVRFDELRVKACGLREGAVVSVGGRASLPALGVTSATVDGTLRWQGGAWTLDLGVTSQVALGPFGQVALAGELAIAGAPGALTVDGCLSGSGALTQLAGLAADLHVAVGRCGDAPATSPVVAVHGRVTLPGGAPATVAGELTLGAAGAWSLAADATGVVLGPFALERATLAVDPTLGASLAGDFTVGPFALRADGHVAAAGPFTIDVGLRAPAELPGGVTVSDAAGSRLEWTGSTWRLVLTVGVEVDAGPFGSIDARGQLDAAWNPATGAFDVSGCVGVVAGLAGLPLDAASAEVCFGDAGAEVRVHGELGGAALDGALVAGPDGLALELAAGGGAGGPLVLAPGLVLADAVVRVAPGAAQAEVRGRLCVDALCLEISGLWVPGGTSTLTASLAAGTPWRPFASLSSLAFTGGVSGTLVLDGADFVLDVVAASTASFTIVPGLTLDAIFARGHLESGGVWSAALGGATSIDFGAESFALTVEGAVDSAGRWALSGSSTARFEPLAPLVGAGRFVVAAPAFSIEVPAGGAPAVSLAATVELCLLGGCAPGTALTAALRGGAVAGGVWFAATVPGLALPGFGTLDATVAASTATLPGFDLLATPGDASDDVTLAPGLTVSAMADLPVRFGPQPARARLTAHVADPSLISVSAGLDLNLAIVTPEHGLPGIAEVSLTTLAVEASIAGGVPTIGVSASARFRPANQENPLDGTAALSMSATGDLGVELSVLGRWYEPFGLPKIAIQNPAFALAINVSSSLPIPSRLGFNGDFFWLKSGTTWPTLTQWPLPAYGQPSSPPPSIMQLGGTFFFDAIPSPSGLCPGVCIPLPALIVRFELHNLGIPDLVKLAGDVKTGVKNVVLGIAPEEHRAALAALIPDGAFTAPVPSPFDVTVNDLELYLSTHNLTQWDMPFSAGFRALLDVTVSGKRAVLRGVLDEEGLLVEGRLEPVKIFGQLLTGDPTRRIAQLGTGGSISVPSDARLTPAAGTVEAHVQAPAAGGTLASKLSGTRGFRVRLLAAAQVCAPSATGGAPSCRSLCPVEVTLGNGTTTRTWTSAPAVAPGVWHHVAVTWSTAAGAAGVRVLVDGAHVATSNPGAALAPASATTTPLTLGAGLTRLDDVRVWNVARPAGEIAAGAGRLPPTAFSDARLVGRWAFDFDKGTTAFNQRLLPAPALHGTYAAGAAPAADVRDQDLYARLRLALPGAGASGFELAAGASLNIPVLGGARQLAASVAVGDGNARGDFFMAEGPLMSLSGFGALIVGGRGPNLAAGDFDDGVFGAFDLKDGGLLASAGLYFQPASAGAARQTLLDGSLSWIGQRLKITGAVAWNATLPGGAPLSLAGQGSYDSATGLVSVNGQLGVFGQNLAAGDIRLGPTGISLRSTVNLSAIAPVPLGETTIDLALTYAPARLCGSGATTIALPGVAQRPSGSVSLCLGHSPSLAFSGSLPSLTVAGVTLTSVAVSYADATGLRVAGDVVIPGVFTGRLSGVWVSATSFELTASGSATLGGFSMTGATLRLSPTGFRATGTLALGGLWTGSTTVAVAANGTFSFAQTVDTSIAGFTLDDAAFTLTQSGLQVAGKVKFLGNTVSIGGALFADGAYRWTSTANVNLGGFPVSGTKVSLAKYTTAHPRLSSAWPESGLRVDGDLAMLGGTLAVAARVDPATGFSFTASPTLNVLGFALRDTTVTLSSAAGLHVRGEVDVGSTDVVVSGSVPSLTSFTLCSASNTSANAAAGLPDLRGRFCLERTSSSASLSGSGSASFWGVSFSTSYDIATNGGIEYLYINAAVASFSLLGVTASGRMKLKVEDNDLKYVRWYGSLYVPNPIPGFGPLVDFDSYINLSAFRLCPSHFGVDPTAVGLPSGCVDLDF